MYNYFPFILIFRLIYKNFRGLLNFSVSLRPFLIELSVIRVVDILENHTDKPYVTFFSFLYFLKLCVLLFTHMLHSPHNEISRLFLLKNCGRANLTDLILFNRLICLKFTLLTFIEYRLVFIIFLRLLAKLADHYNINTRNWDILLALLVF